MSDIIHLGWENINSRRAYPLRSGLAYADTTGLFRIPENLLLDAQIAASSNPALRLHISKIVWDFVNLELYISDFSGQVVGHVTVDSATHVEGNFYNLIAGEAYAGANGKLQFGEISQQNLHIPGSFVFAQTVSEFEPRTVIPSVTSVNRIVYSKADGTYGSVTGDVLLEAGRNIRFSSAGQTITLDAGDGLGLNTRNCDPSRIIRSINGIGPDVNGNFRIEGAECLKITPGENAITLRDTCSKPCVSCDAVDELTAQLQAQETKLFSARNRLNELRTAHMALRDNINQLNLCQPMPANAELEYRNINSRTAYPFSDFANTGFAENVFLDIVVCLRTQQPGHPYLYRLRRLSNGFSAEFRDSVSSDVLGVVVMPLTNTGDFYHSTTPLAFIKVIPGSGLNDLPAIFDTNYQPGQTLLALSAVIPAMPLLESVTHDGTSSTLVGPEITFAEGCNFRFTGISSGWVSDVEPGYGTGLFNDCSWALFTVNGIIPGLAGNFFFHGDKSCYATHRISGGLFLENICHKPCEPEDFDSVVSYMARLDDFAHQLSVKINTFLTELEETAQAVLDNLVPLRTEFNAGVMINSNIPAGGPIFKVNIVVYNYHNTTEQADLRITNGSEVVVTLPVPYTNFTGSGTAPFIGQEQLGFSFPPFSITTFTVTAAVSNLSGTDAELSFGFELDWNTNTGPHNITQNIVLRLT